MKLPSKYIAIDIETTDADAENGDVIQIGAIVLNEDLSMGEKFSIYIRPTIGYRNPVAMKVNGITEEMLTMAPPHSIALQEFEKFTMPYGDRPLLAAWGTYFDVGFLRAYYKKIGRKWPFSYRCLDFKSIAIWEAAKYDKAETGGLDSFLDWLELDFEGNPHDALDDIKNTIRIIQTLCQDNV